MDEPRINDKPARDYLAVTDEQDKALLIIGSHPEGMSADAANTYGCDVMAVNLAAAGVYCRYMATLHSYELGTLPGFLESVHPLTTVIGFCTGCEHKRVDTTLSIEPAGGTSALFAVVAGLTLGYKRIMVSGVRLEPGSIYHDEHVVKNWATWAPLFRGVVSVLGPKTWLTELINDGRRID